MEIRGRLNIVSPDLVMEPLLRLLAETSAVPLVVSGSRMTPFLVPGRDNGGDVLGRILRVNGDSYTMAGDAQAFRNREFAGSRFWRLLPLCAEKRNCFKGQFLVGIFREGMDSAGPSPSADQRYLGYYQKQRSGEMV